MLLVHSPFMVRLLF